MALRSESMPGSSKRKYLSLEPLSLLEVPPHPEFRHDSSQHTITLATFLNHILTEASRIDFDNGWDSHGMAHLGARRATVLMPYRDGSRDQVPINVEQRVKDIDRDVWLARRSHHHMRHVKYLELDKLLAQDHCRMEAEYTTSVYDANELLKWDSEHLRRAVAELDPKWRASTVQMSIYQMFHIIPAPLLQDRVFHVLVTTVHSSYTLPNDGDPRLHPQSLTFQLPINLKSFKGISTIMQRSHMQESPKRYVFPDASLATQKSPTVRQKNRIGKRLTEGVYVSLERLRRAASSDEEDNDDEMQRASREQSEEFEGTSGMHIWDMMTMSDAKGVTRLAPSKITMKETLGAIAKDVYDVIDLIRQQRE